MQVNSVKLFKQHLIMTRECFPIVPAWFAEHNSGPTLKNLGEIVIFHFCVSVPGAMLVDVKEPCRFFWKTTDAGNMFKTFVCVQRAITRMQNAFLDKVRVQWTSVPGGWHRSEMHLNFSLKISHKSDEYASKQCKTVYKAFYNATRTLSNHSRMVCCT